MAYTKITPQQVVEAGTAGTYAAPSGAGAGNGDSIPGDGRTFLHVKNTGGTVLTVTIKIPFVAYGHTIADATVTVPATTGDKMIGPFPAKPYNQPTSNATHAGRVLVEYSSVTSMTRAVVSLINA